MLEVKNLDLLSVPTTTAELNRQNLLKSQLLWLNKNISTVKGKAIKLYDKYKELIGDYYEYKL